jgi:hypothetical protein
MAANAESSVMADCLPSGKTPDQRIRNRLDSGGKMIVVGETITEKGADHGNIPNAKCV